MSKLMLLELGGISVFHQFLILATPSGDFSKIRFQNLRLSWSLQISEGFYHQYLFTPHTNDILATNPRFFFNICSLFCNKSSPEYTRYKQLQTYTSAQYDLQNQRTDVIQRFIKTNQTCRIPGLDIPQTVVASNGLCHTACCHPDCLVCGHHQMIFCIPHGLCH